ncbi:unnamed protein product [Calypogeia fissa]
MASSAERLHFYRLYYHELCAAQSQIPLGELHCREARLQQAELRMLEELIMLFAMITPCSITNNETTTNNNAKPASAINTLDVSLVTNILLLSPPSPWILYIVVWSVTEWRLCYVSPSVKRLLGWRPSDVVGKPIWEGCHQEDVPILQKIFHPKCTNTASFSSSNCLLKEKSYTLGEFVMLRRLRRDQSVASMHGTGMAIGSKWYAWVEQDTSALKLSLVGSNGVDATTSNRPLTNPHPEKVPMMDAKSSNKNEFQPPPIVVQERVVEAKPEEGNHKTTMREIKTTPMTKPSSLPSVARSKEIKSRKAYVGQSSRQSSRNSSIESLPAHIDISPHVLPSHVQKINDVNDKVMDLMEGKSVLLVDDSNTYLKGGQALLAKMGCHVFIAHNGEEALQMMQHLSPMADIPRQFDVVFMDLSMPKMDGIQAVKLFRVWEGNQQSGRTRTLIIAVTANDTDGGMVLCAQTGFDGFVTKPLNKKKILDCLAASNE